MNESAADTIVAPATPIGRSALAIVRIDGPGALGILGGLSGREEWEPRRARRVDLSHEGEAIDESVAIFFAGPASFTGNDLVELTLHGSPVTVRRLIEAVVDLGARRAQPGEFTERAVLNGRIDLVQAEAIADLIDARTDLQARLSLANLGGRLSDEASAVRAILLDVVSRLEAALDFADEGYEFIGREEAVRALEDARSRVDGMLETSRRGEATTSGLTAVLLGRPNAGKSTLLNALVGSDRAIVTPIAGTTRDLLRETIEIGGLPVTVIDTAGLRETAEEVESIGILRTREAASSADLILYLVDAAEGLSPEDERELRSLRDPLVVYTKADLAAPPAEARAISVATGRGLRDLLGELDRWVEREWRVPEGRGALVNQRQKEEMERCALSLEAAIRSLMDGVSEEVTLVDLNLAARAIGELTGEISHAEVMEAIFSRFCIGK